MRVRARGEQVVLAFTARGKSLAAFGAPNAAAAFGDPIATGDASPGAALLLLQIQVVFSVVAPCPRGASPVSVRRQTFTTGCSGQPAAVAGLKVGATSRLSPWSSSASPSRPVRVRAVSRRRPRGRRPRGSPPVTDTLHGVQIVDRYRWLEGDNGDPNDPGKVTPDVAAWTDAQNGYTRSVLDNLPGRKALEERLRPLMDVGAVTAPIVRGNRYFFSKREGARTSRHLLARGRAGDDRVADRPGRARPVRPDDRRMVLAVARRQAARVRHLSRRRPEHDAAPDGRRHRRGRCRSRFRKRPQGPTGCPTAPGSSIRT